MATQFYRPKDFGGSTSRRLTLFGRFLFYVAPNSPVALFHDSDTNYLAGRTNVGHVSHVRSIDAETQEDGKYVLMRDPNKAMLNLYSVPPATFDDE